MGGGYSGSLAHPLGPRPPVEQVQLLFSKSKVYVYRGPGAGTAQQIPGFLSIFKRGSRKYVAWTPEISLAAKDAEAHVEMELVSLKQLLGSDTGSLSDTEGDSFVMVSLPAGAANGYNGSNEEWVDDSVTAYSFCAPLSDIVSLIVHPPSLTQWHGSVIINANSNKSALSAANARQRPVPIRALSGSVEFIDVNSGDATDLDNVDRAVQDKQESRASQTITFPPLWFHDSESASTIAGEGLIWGGDQLLAWISREKHVQQSASDPTLYLVSASPPTTFPPSPPAQFPKSLSASWTPVPTSPVGSTRNIVSIATTTTTTTTGTSPIQRAAATTTTAATSQSQPLQPTIDSLLGAMSPLVSTLKTTQWNILEGFSKVTRFTREAAQSVVEHPLARPILPHLPSQVREFASPSYNAATNSEVSREYEGARLYLAKWAASNMERLRKANDSSNDAQEGSSVSDELGQFELLSGSANAGLPPLLRSREPSPVTLTEWNSMLDDNGALVESAEHVRRLVFSRGVHADARCIVWKYLLGVYPWSSSEEERRVIDRTGADLYYEMKMAWLQDADTLASEEIVEQKSRIKKDVLRTDRTVPMFAPSEQYHPDHRDDENEDGDGDGDGEGEGLPGTNYNLEQMKDILLSYHFHNRALGYVQGMSDLLAPIYYVVADEAQAFWCFARFMDRMQSHFLRDQSGMSRELDCLKDLVRLLLPRLYSHLQSMDALHFFFCFRWLLIWFKREFEFMDVIALWEVFWTDYLSGDFHLFVAVAILELHSDVIVDHLERFDEVLKYINDLSMNIDVNQVLRGAEQMYYRLQRAVNLSDQQSDTSTIAKSGDERSTSEEPSNQEGIAPPNALLMEPISNQKLAGGTSQLSTLHIPDSIRHLLRRTLG